MVALQNWVAQARRHWKEFQPERYRALVNSGKLDAALREAAERTYRELTELEGQGFDHQDAWEIVRERYLFLPEEGKNQTAYAEGHFCRPTLTIASHKVIATGPRTMEISPPCNGSRLTTARLNPEVRRASQRERDEPIINILSGSPLDKQRVRHYSERRGFILFLIWIVVSVPLVELGWIGAIAAVLTACLLAYIEHIQRERDREAGER